jgi:heme exporter protein B
VSAVTALLRRELRLAARQRTELLMPLAFFVGAAGIFPLAVGPEPQMLRTIAPGIVWVCALLASMLSMPRLFAADLQDGTLEQLLLSDEPLALLVAAKLWAHWLTQGAPLVLVSPLLALMFGLPADTTAVLLLSLLLGTTVLSGLGALAAALTLGLRAGAVLLVVLVLPLAVPALVFGAGAVTAVEAGLSASAHLSLLGAMAIASAIGTPVATAAALRIALDG